MATFPEIEGLVTRVVRRRGTGVWIKGREQAGSPDPRLLARALEAQGVRSDLPVGLAQRSTEAALLLSEGEVVLPADVDVPAGQVVTSATDVVASDSLVADDTFVLVDATAGNVTVTLASAATVSHPVTIKRTDGTGNTVTVLPGGGSQIDSDTGILVPPNLGPGDVSAVTFLSDGTDWWVV